MNAALDPQQQLVRDAPMTGWKVVQAPAGAGKTRVLVERAISLAGRRVPPSRLLYLTFTNAAAAELRTRLKAVGMGRCRVMTIHGLASVHLKAAGFTRIEEDDPEWRTTVRFLSDTYGVSEATMERRIERAWMSQGPDQSYADHELLLTLTSALAESDGAEPRTYLLGRTLGLLRDQWEAEPHRLAEERATFDEVIVDEAQDLSQLQAELVRSLAADKSLVLVGDPWQSIYSFQGAVPGVFGQFAAEAGHQITLVRNYRSPAQHLMVAEALTGRATIPSGGFRGSLSVHWADRDLGTALKTAAATLAARGPFTLLAATRAELKWAGDQLRSAGLDVNDLSQQSKVLDSGVRNVLTPVVDYLVRRGTPTGAHPLAKVHGLVDRRLTPAERAVLDAAWITGEAVGAVQARLGADLQLFLTLWSALDAWRGRVNELPALLRQVVTTKTSLRKVQSICRRAHTLSDLARNLGLPCDADVIARTIHGCKGAEFPQVLLYAGQHRPHPDDTPEDRREAQRVAYVAVTRSTRDLTAVLHRNAPPAFQTAFAPEVIARIERLTHFIDHGGDATPDLLDDLTASRSVVQFLQEHGAQASDQGASDRLATLLLTPLLASSASLTATRLERVPLRGGPRAQCSSDR